MPETGGDGPADQREIDDETEPVMRGQAFQPDIQNIIFWRWERWC